MTSKVHLALFLLFACTVTVSAVEDNFQGENGEKFSQQNGPSYTYEINKQVIWSDDEYFNAVAIWPVTGQGFQNTKWPAVRYFQ